MTALAMALLALAGVATTVAADDSAWELQIPPVSNASTPLPPSYISLSIEYQFFPHFTGNFSHPNEFSLDLIRSLADVGDPLFIRIGGSTEDRIYYNESFPQAIESFFWFWWESNPYNGTMGPSFFDGISLLPSDFRYVYGINEGGFNDSSGHHSDSLTLANIEKQTEAAYKAIGDRLWAIEPGNEVSGFNFSYQGVWYRDPKQDWNLTDFVREAFNTSYDALQGTIIPGDPHKDQSQNPLWRAGDLSGFKRGWTFEDAWTLGQNAWHRLREYSVHLYPATICDARLGAKVTIENSVLNHTLTAVTLEPNRARAAFTAAQGVEFVIGEFNSVSCSGKPGVSDAFGAALWSFDSALYSASIGVKRVYYHQGADFAYAGIWPVEMNGTLPAARSAYYGYILGSLAVGSTEKGTSGKRVANILNDTSVVAYALYSSDSWSPGGWYDNTSSVQAPRTLQRDVDDDSWRLTDIALLNLRPFNQSTPQNKRGNITFTVGSEWNGAKVVRLTAPGSDTLPFTKGDAPWLETHEREGLIQVGCHTYTAGHARRICGCTDETVANGVVTLLDSEAVLISKA